MSKRFRKRTLETKDIIKLYLDRESTTEIAKLAMFHEDIIFCC